jgi:hypothetical protein
MTAGTELVATTAAAAAIIEKVRIEIFLEMFRQANRRSAFIVAAITMNRVWPSV